MTEEKFKECGECDGTGRLMADGCEACNSNGWVDDPSDGGTMTCPECLGDAGEECPDCEGEGRLDKQGFAPSYATDEDIQND